MFIAADLASFQSLFADKLRRMLDAEELGAFILVLANSMQDSTTCEALSEQLRAVYRQHKASLEADTLNAAADDVFVFRQLIATGIDGYCEWTHHQKGDWLQLYNPLRALRPPRVSADVVETVRKDFDANAFHFNKPFLKPEIFWQGEVTIAGDSVEANVLYNKFPFLPYHFLLVFQPQDCHPQFLAERFHESIWNLCEAESDALPGIGFGYNSVGACASVNHLHFQGFILDRDLPIEIGKWQHNGGDEDYPMACMAFDDATSCWQQIEKLHAANRPYNLLYRPGRCYLLMRKMQGDEGVHERVRGAGWIEACGVFSEATMDAINKLSAPDLEDEIRSLSADG